jgi:hypothetical protein
MNSNQVKQELTELRPAMPSTEQDDPTHNWFETELNLTQEEYDEIFNSAPTYEESSLPVLTQQELDELFTGPMFPHEQVADIPMDYCDSDPNWSSDSDPNWSSDSNRSTYATESSASGSSYHYASESSYTLRSDSDAQSSGFYSDQYSSGASNPSAVESLFSSDTETSDASTSTDDNYCANFYIQDLTDWLHQWLHCAVPDEFGLYNIDVANGAFTVESLRAWIHGIQQFAVQTLCCSIGVSAMNNTDHVTLRHMQHVLNGIQRGIRSQFPILGPHDQY